MPRSRADRRVALLGLGLAVLSLPLLVAASVAAPRGDELVAFVQEHAWLAVAFTATSPVGLSLTVAWLVGLRSVLIDRSRRWLVLDCALAVGIFGFVTTLVAYPLLGVVAFAPREALLDIAFAILNVGTGPASAISVAAFTYVLAQSDLRHPAIAAVAAVVVVAHLALAVTFFPDGLLAPSGVLAWLAPALYYVWVGAISWRILRS